MDARAVAPTPSHRDGSAGTGSADARRITRNSLYLIAGQLLGRAIGLGYTLTLARLLGVQDFGLYNLVMGLLAIAITAVDFGLARLVLRDLAREPLSTARYLATLVPLRVALALAGYALLLAVVALSGYGQRTLLLVAISGVTLLPTALGMLFDVLFHARQQMRHSAAGDVVLAITQLVVGVGVLLAGGGLEVVLASNIVAACAYAGYLARQVRANGEPLPWRPDWRLARELLVKAAPYALVTLLAMLASRTELLLLGALTDAQALGLFSAAAKFPETCLLLPAVFTAAAAPVLAQCHADAPARLPEVYGWMLRRVLLATLPVALVGVVLAPVVIDTLFASTYAAAAPLMQLLFAGLPLAAAQLVNSAMLTMSNRTRLMIVTALLTTVMQGLLAAWWISHLGATGAAWSAALAPGLAFLLVFACLRRWMLGPVALGRQTTGPLLAVAAGALALWALPADWGPWRLLPVLGTYSAVLLVQGALWPPAAKLPAPQAVVA